MVCKIDGHNTAESVHDGEHVKISSSPIQKTPQPSRQSTKLRNMNISIETKLVIKFGAPDVRRIELRAKKLPRVYTIENMRKAP